MRVTRTDPLRTQSSEEALGSFSLIRSITEESVSVVTSPISRFSAMSRSSRRMILPERVLGSSCTTMIWRGLAIGPIAKPRQIMIVKELPKTRSGKIMRRLLRDVAENREVGDVTTLADSSVMDLISEGLSSDKAED